MRRIKEAAVAVQLVKDPGYTLIRRIWENVSPHPPRFEEMCIGRLLAAAAEEEEEELAGGEVEVIIIITAPAMILMRKKRRKSKKRWKKKKGCRKPRVLPWGGIEMIACSQLEVKPAVSQVKSSLN